MKYEVILMTLVQYDTNSMPGFDNVSFDRQQGKAAFLGENEPFEI